MKTYFILAINHNGTIYTCCYTAKNILQAVEKFESEDTNEIFQIICPGVLNKSFAPV